MRYGVQNAEYIENNLRLPILDALPEVATVGETLALSLWNSRGEIKLVLMDEVSGYLVVVPCLGARSLDDVVSLQFWI